MMKKTKKKQKSQDVHGDVEHFVAVAGVGLDEDALVRVPQFDALVLTAAQAVVAIACHKPEFYID
jgi:hypothetical protein